MKSLHTNRIRSTMSDGWHCSDSQLRRLLRPEKADEDSKSWTHHLESCDVCQTRLEGIVEKGVELDELKQYLGPPSDSVDRRDAMWQDAKQSASCGSAAADFLSPSDRAASLGRFARYEVEDVIGAGGMGVVLKGYDEALNRYAAIKVLAPVLATSASARKRFSREAKSSAAVVHDHVVPIHTVDEEHGLPYFVMPLIEGESLEQRVATNGPLELKEILRIGKQVAAGLAAAHEQGIVHRDVKPANILLENGVERVLITDFGLARAIDDASVTQSGVIAGTPQYMSPEQARGDTLDHRSDLFSLGSVLYFMCTGHAPFRAESTMGILRRISDECPRPIGEVNTDIPPWFEAIVAKLLAKDPADRFTSAAEVSERFGQWLAHEQQPAAAARPPEVEVRAGAAGEHPGHRTPGLRRPFFRAAVACVVVSLLFLLVAAAVGVFKLGETTIQFEINDPGLIVHFGDQTITVKNDGDVIHIRPGDKNAFVITKEGEDSRIVASLFELRKGQNVVLKVSTSNGRIQVTPNDGTAQIDTLVDQVLKARGGERPVPLDPELMLELVDSVTGKVHSETPAESLRNRVLEAAGLIEGKRKDAPRGDGVSAAWGDHPDFTFEELERIKASGRKPAEGDANPPDRKSDAVGRETPYDQQIAEAVLSYRLSTADRFTVHTGLSILKDGSVIIPIGEGDEPVRSKIDRAELDELLKLFGRVHPHFRIKGKRTKQQLAEFEAATKSGEPHAFLQVSVRTSKGMFIVVGPRRLGDAKPVPEEFEILWELQRRLEAIRRRLIRQTAASLFRENLKASREFPDPESPGFKPLSATFMAEESYFYKTFGRDPVDVIRMQREKRALHEAGFEHELITRIVSDPEKTRAAIEALKTLLEFVE